MALSEVHAQDIHFCVTPEHSSPLPLVSRVVTYLHTMAL